MVLDAGVFFSVTAGIVGVKLTYFTDSMEHRGSYHVDEFAYVCRCLWLGGRYQRLKREGYSRLWGDYQYRQDCLGFCLYVIFKLFLEFFESNG
jgi:hypothetical protein